MLVFAVIYWNLGAPRINVAKPTPIWRKGEYLADRLTLFVLKKRLADIAPDLN